MVVTRKSTNPNAPPAPSRTNSSTSTPKAAKKASVKGSSHLKEGHLAASGVENKPVAPPTIPALHPEDDGPFGQNPTFLPSPPKKDKFPGKKHMKKTQPRDKLLKGRKRDRRSLNTLEVLLRIFFLLLSIYSVLVCPKDTKNESAVCHKLSVARERIFDPYILPPIRFVANHPAVAPHIAHAKPHIKNTYDVVSTQYDALYKKLEVAARPYIVQMQREYNIRLRPQIRVMQYNWRRYRRQAQPYINQAYAVGFRLWIRTEPYVTPVLAKVEEAPALASLYLVRPLEEAKQKWVDPQLRKIVAKVEEMNASVVSEEASTVASAAEDTITPTTGDLNGNREASTTPMGNARTVPEGGFVAPPEPPMYPTNSHDTGVENTRAADPNHGKTPDNLDAELEAFLADLLKEEEKVPEPVATPQSTPLTPEERAERARLRKVETAHKRADIEARHTKWEEKLNEAGEHGEEELVDALVAKRESALHDINNEGGVIQTTIADLKKEALKAKKHVQLYFEELKKDKKSDEQKFKDWIKVLGKVDEKVNERIKETQEKVQKWVHDWINAEQKLIEVIAERLTRMAYDAQSDLGLDYTWLDDVSTHDWTRYHELNREARRWESVYQDLHTGVDLEAPANPVNLRLTEVQADIQLWVKEFAEDNGKLHLMAVEMWQPHKQAPTPEAPEVSILPIDVEEPAVMVGGVPVDQIVIGRGEEEVQEAFARAEGDKPRGEL